MRRLGSGVTLIERGLQIASSEDSDVAAAILELFRDEGLHVLLGTEVLRVDGLSGQLVAVELQAGSHRRSLRYGPRAFYLGASYCAAQILGAGTGVALASLVLWRAGARSGSLRHNRPDA